ncbi:hypothetical protein GCM10017783_17950 [Deinococcus piscis]|uniref:DinB-like domain-containing protein n=1 Tax=Deinococcus piscis TaxID=394230 RepID=A0ABQ3K9P5_9DEIO|nr:DUF1572 family protein [Deinococcus piscis]GHG05760.1 hypothetical protein GCM10017783_17950 [Deinococcus piscis]
MDTSVPSGLPGSDLGQLYLDDARERSAQTRRLGEKALAQLEPGDWHRVHTAGDNSVAVLVQHLAGNMQSRWGLFRAGYRPGVDGESPDRNRDSEFVDQDLDPAQLRELWDRAWTIFEEALAALRPQDLSGQLTIRGEPHTVLGALQRQLLHNSGHVYQLVMLAKSLRGSEWQTASIPRGGSQAHNHDLASRFGVSGDGQK